jgi:hypothetical protein
LPFVSINKKMMFCPKFQRFKYWLDLLQGPAGAGPGPVGYSQANWFQFQWEEKNGQLVRRTNFVRAQFKIVFAEIHKKITGSGGYPTTTTTSQYCIST